MASIIDTADKFFVACDTGKGWQVCKGPIAHQMRHLLRRRSRSQM
jgi:hypothetical protein